MNKHIFDSPLPGITVPELSITDFVLQRASTQPDKAAIINGADGSSLSFAQLQRQIKQLAGGLKARGFVTGDVLALMAANSPEYAIVFHAAAWAGGTVTTINPAYGTAEVRQQLQDSSAKLMVCDNRCLTLATQAIEHTNVKSLATIHPEPTHESIQVWLDEPIEQVNVDLHNQPMVLPYSSGTTGLPKGVMLSHHNLVANLVQINATVEYDTEEIGLAVLPFFHIFGMQVLLGSMLSEGHTIITMARFDMEQALQLIERHRVTQFYVVPPIVLGLAKSPLVDQYDVSSLRKILSGAAPLGIELTQEVTERINCPVVQGYGMTELSPVSHVTPGLKSKPGTSGVTAPDTQCRIVDQHGHDLAANETGELLVKGPQVMMGYLNNVSATEETLDNDGWLHTGDLASIDHQGYLTIIDRVKELIKYKGFQVAPAELEAVLIAHSNVADVAVIGVPDAEAGEIPKAFVVHTSPIESLDEKTRQNAALALMELTADQLASYKTIRAVEWVESIPKSPSGKILRRVLRDQSSPTN